METCSPNFNNGCHLFYIKTAFAILGALFFFFLLLFHKSNIFMNGSLSNNTHQTFSFPKKYKECLS